MQSQREISSLRQKTSGSNTTQSNLELKLAQHQAQATVRLQAAVQAADKVAITL